MLQKWIEIHLHNSTLPKKWMEIHLHISTLPSSTHHHIPTCSTTNTKVGPIRQDLFPSVLPSLICTTLTRSQTPFVQTKTAQHTFVRVCHNHTQVCVAQWTLLMQLNITCLTPDRTMSCLIRDRAMSCLTPDGTMSCLPSGRTMSCLTPDRTMSCLTSDRTKEHIIYLY